MSCVPAVYDFSIYEGLDCKILKTTNNEDLTGATIAFTATSDRGSPTPEIEIAGVIDDAATGKYHIPLSKSDTEGLVTNKALSLYYDVLITSSGGDVSGDTRGTIILNPRARS